MSQVNQCPIIERFPVLLAALKRSESLAASEQRRADDWQAKYQELHNMTLLDFTVHFKRLEAERDAQKVRMDAAKTLLQKYRIEQCGCCDEI